MKAGRVMTAGTFTATAITSRWFSRALILFGCGCLGWVAFGLLQAKAFERFGEQRLAEASRALHRHGAITGKTLKLAQAARTEARTSGVIGRISLPRAGISAIIAEGTTDTTLSRSVGHVPGSAFPGENGNTVLAAHRETHFRGLKMVQTGDRAILTTPDGAFEYRVESTSIVGPADTEVMQETPDSMLTLITCYPFNYLGHAPQRYVVRARQVLRPI